MKFLDMVGTSASNLWRNKGRTFLTVIAIFIGAFTITLTSAVNSGVNDYFSSYTITNHNNIRIRISHLWLMLWL